MTSRFCALRFLWVFSVLGCAARAELRWTQKVVLLEPPAGAVNATTFFECTNVGNAPVRLVEVRSACGCTAAALEKTLLEPGETTRVTAVYHTGERRGHQSVDVTVVTDEPQANTYSLTLQVQIKEFATVTPKNVYWNVGDDGAPKVITVSLLPGFRLLDAKSATEQFTVEIVSSDEKHTQLRVQPKDTWAKRVGAIQVRVGKGNENAASISATLRVM